jgi:hypothetical protein
MRRALVSIGIAVALVATGATRAVAQARFDAPVRFDQQRPAPRAPARRPAPSPKPKRGLRAFGLVDVEAMAASQTFKAITGSARLIGFGGGVEVLNVWHHAFVRGAFSRAGKDAERAFVVGGQVINNGVTGKIQMTPIEIAGGWRVETKGGQERAGVYAGGGALVLQYKETYTLATSDEDTSQTFTGAVLFGGVDRRFGKWLVAGVEAQYRSLPGAIGDSDTSVAKAFGEKDLGGFVVRVLVGVRK